MIDQFRENGVSCIVFVREPDPEGLEEIAKGVALTRVDLLESVFCGFDDGEFAHGFGFCFIRALRFGQRAAIFTVPA